MESEELKLRQIKTILLACLAFGFVVFVLISNFS